MATFDSTSSMTVELDISLSDTYSLQILPTWAKKEGDGENQVVKDGETSWMCRITTNTWS